MSGFSLNAPLVQQESGSGFSLNVSLAATKPPPDITAPMPRPEDAPDAETGVAEVQDHADRDLLKKAFYAATAADDARIESVMQVDFYVCAVFNNTDDAERFAREAGLEIDEDLCVDGYKLAKKMGLTSTPSVDIGYPRISTAERWRKLAMDALPPPREFAMEWDGKGRMPVFPDAVTPDDMRVLQLHRERGEPLPPHLVLPDYMKEGAVAVPAKKPTTKPAKKRSKK